MEEGGGASYNCRWEMEAGKERSPVGKRGQVRERGKVEKRWDRDTEEAKLGVFGSPFPFLLLPLLPDVLQLPVVEDEVGAGALAAHDGHTGVAALDLAPRPAAKDAQQKVHELAARARSLGRLLGLACLTLGTARSAVVTLCWCSLISLHFVAAQET